MKKIIFLLILIITLIGNYAHGQVDSPKFPECKCAGWNVQIGVNGKDQVVKNGGLIEFSNGSILTLSATLKCEGQDKEYCSACSRKAHQVLDEKGNIVKPWTYGEFPKDLNTDKLECNKVYTLVLQGQCGCTTCEAFTVKFTKICCPIPDQKCTADFKIILEQTTNAIYQITAKPTILGGVTHYWGLVPVNDCTGFTHVPLANIVGGSTFGSMVSATGVCTAPLGMGTGTTCGPSTFGFQYGGLGVGKCYKISHYIKCCDKWFVMTKCFCLLSTMKMAKPTEQDLQVSSTEVEEVAEKDVPQNIKKRNIDDIKN